MRNERQPREKNKTAGSRADCSTHDYVCGQNIRTGTGSRRRADGAGCSRRLDGHHRCGSTWAHAQARALIIRIGFVVLVHVLSSTYFNILVRNAEVLRGVRYDATRVRLDAGKASDETLSSANVMY